MFRENFLIGQPSSSIRISEEEITATHKKLTLDFFKEIDFTRKKSISLASCNIDQHAIGVLFSKLKKATNVISLDLSGSKIYNNINALNEFPFLFSKGKGVLWDAPNLTYLNLSGNDLEGWCLKGIKDYLLSHLNLRVFDLNNNKLDQSILKDFAKGIEQSALEQLNLSHNNINWQGFSDLVYGLLENKNNSLKYLDVSENPLNDNAACSIRLLLNENSSLKYLGLGKVDFTPCGWKEIYQGLKERKEKGKEVDAHFFSQEIWDALENCKFEFRRRIV